MGLVYGFKLFYRFTRYLWDFASHTEVVIQTKQDSVKHQFN